MLEATLLHVPNTQVDLTHSKVYPRGIDDPQCPTEEEGQW